MKIVKIANLAITVILASFVASCVKEQPKEETPEETPVNFTVQLGKADAEYAEVVVRHDGQKDATWYGFITKDLESSVESLIQAQLSGINANSLHIGNSQTVALRNLEEFENYRYVAFGINADGERYGEPGALAFSTSPIFDVTFQAEATDVQSHEASFAVSHDGIDVLTYMAFVTEDVNTDVAALAAEHYASIVGDNGKLNEGVELLKGTSGTVTVSELTHESDYRFIIYGVYDNNGAIIYYGTPAEVEFSTPVDLSLVNFSAAISDITTESAKATVTYDAKNEELSWYGFVTGDLTSPAASLISAAISGLSADDLQTGKDKALDLTGLTIETEYRYIVTGVKDGKAFGVPADAKFATLSEAYVNCQFTIVASDITPYGATLTITHTGLEDFQYHGFFTEDLDSALADLEVPSNADNDLMTGLEKVLEVEDLQPLTKYRYVVVGRYNGNEYGHRGEVVFETPDNAVAASYEDFLGEWKMQEGTKYIFTVEQKVAGESYTVKGLNNSTVANYGIDTPLEVEALFVGGKLTIASQAVSESYVDPEDEKTYTDKFCGKYVSASNGNTYFDNEMGRVVVSFVLIDNGNVELRPGQTKDAEDYISFRYFQVPEGGGSSYAQDKMETALPNVAAPFVKKAATYEDFLGQWKLGDYTMTISAKASGSTYKVTGLFDLEELYGGIHELEACYDAVNHEFYIMEQKLGAFDTADVEAFGSNQYGMCDDFFLGIFSYNTSTYPGYGYNTDTPARLFTAFINGDDVVEINPGACSYGPFVGFDYWWIIRTGENAGKGNSYHASGSSYSYAELPDTMTKVGSGASVSSASLSQDISLSRFSKLSKSELRSSSIAK